MSLAPVPDRLRLPESLTKQLADFRQRVWKIKLVEAACGAAFGILAAWLAMFVVDRLTDTPGWVRATLFAASLIGCALFPLAVHRWVWSHRRLEQLARLIGRRFPSLGDQLLGVIELTHNQLEQDRSRALCEAAIRQVADDAGKRDFSTAVPSPRHRQWSIAVALFALGAAGLWLVFPAAASNAWVRLMAPWSRMQRFTFAAVNPLPEKLVVPHGEPFPLKASLKETTQSRPEAGRVQVGQQQPVDARLQNDAYTFELPSQLDESKMRLKIGDYSQLVTVTPMVRPELTAVKATVKLPDYLKRTELLSKDLRGGSLALVRGSQVEFNATVSRELEVAAVDGQKIKPQGAAIHSPSYPVDQNQRVALEWKDQFGLSGREPFVITITGREDEAPSLACEDLPRQKIVLDSETLNFKLRAQDDFGIRQVGMEWVGAENQTVENLAKGERILGAGSPDRETLELAGTFSAKTLGIEPQLIQVRLFVEDYLPDRERVYSPTYTLYVLSPEDHAIWITEQLHKWHRQSLEVRDREMQLYETNKELRGMSPEQLDQADVRRRIENQSTAERANGRRLTALSNAGEELLKQAARNPELGVGHLEKWAEMLNVLKDISGNRMPSVADLLKQSSQAQLAASSPPQKSAPQAGQNRDQSAGSGGSKDEQKPNPAVPSVVDRESSQQPPDAAAKPGEPPPPGGKPSLGLVTTTLSGGKSKPGESCPPAQKLDEAVEEQRDLLAEFEKISEELNRVLANLEGSTLVKRLKAASRKQYDIAGRIGDQIGSTFGRQGRASDPKAAGVIEEMRHQEESSSQDVSTIMDDMQSYFERRRLTNFKNVLEEMKKVDIVGNLRTLADELKKENGLSMAQAEYWSDNLDRWAEDLVDPAKGGT